MSQVKGLVAMPKATVTKTQRDEDVNIVKDAIFSVLDNVDALPPEDLFAECVAALGGEQWGNPLYKTGTGAASDQEADRLFDEAIAELIRVGRIHVLPSGDLSWAIWLPS